MGLSPNGTPRPRSPCVNHYPMTGVDTPSPQAVAARPAASVPEIRPNTAPRITELAPG